MRLLFSFFPVETNGGIEHHPVHPGGELGCLIETTARFQELADDFLGQVPAIAGSGTLFHPLEIEVLLAITIVFCSFNTGQKQGI